MFKKVKKIVIDESMGSILEKPRRSSLQVNLSYLTNSPESTNNDSYEESLKNYSPLNEGKQKSLELEKPQRTLPRIISIECRGKNEENFSKDLLLNENCSQLRTEILRKTKELYQNNSHSELISKTEQVLQEKNNYHHQIKKFAFEEIPSTSSFKKSPSVKVALNEDEQLTMSGSKNKNLISLNIMKSPLVTKMETPRSSRISPKSSNERNGSNLPRKRLFSGSENLSSPILSGTCKKRGKCFDNLNNVSLKCSTLNNDDKKEENPEKSISMEMTTISSVLPIGTSKIFEETPKSSQDKRIISMELTKVKGNILSTPWKKGEISPDNDVITLSSNTTRTSLNVNTSLDQTSQNLSKQTSRVRFTNSPTMENNETNSKSKLKSLETINEENCQKPEERKKLSLNSIETTKKKIDESCEKIRKRGKKFSLSLNSESLTKNGDESTLITNDDTRKSRRINESCQNTNSIGRKRKKLFNLRSNYDESVAILEENVPLSEKGEILRPTSEKKKRMGNSIIEVGETSRVEVTPYPISRSYMWKSQIKQNTFASNSHESPEKSAPTINEELKQKRRKHSKEKHPALESSESDVPNQRGNSSRETSETSSKSSLKINESLNDSKVMGKKKLYPLRGHSELLSMTPVSTPTPKPKIIQRRRKNVKWQKLKETQRTQRMERTQIKNTDTDASDEEFESKIVKTQKKGAPKKPRKVLRKKIIIKPLSNSNSQKLTDKRKRTLINNELSESRTSSLTDFELVEEEKRKKVNKRFHIVTTGFSNGDKNRVKNIVKDLGKTEIGTNVTRKTTHVVSTGVRTINLLKGILRGCWLVSLEWVLKSQEAGKWLNPEPFELAHFSESVKENRRERQLFGNAYVSELFLNCGLIYIAGGTNPSPSMLKELIKTAGGRITENPNEAKIKIGSNGLREIWILDSITTGKLQSTKQYRQK